MSQNWTSFFDGVSGADRNTKIDIFGFAVRTAPWPFETQVKLETASLFYRLIFDTIHTAGWPIGTLRYTSPEVAMAINAHSRQIGGEMTGWFGIDYREPGREFGITVDENHIQIRTGQILLADLVELTKAVFEPLSSALLVPEIDQMLRTAARCSGVNFIFENNFILGSDRLNPQVAVHNYDLMAQALNLRSTGNGQTLDPSTADALPSLGTKQFIRVDYTQHAIKRYGDRDYNVMVCIEAPWNRTQRRLDVRTELRMEEEFGLDLTEALDWKVALGDFYRDTILQRLFRNLFWRTEYEYA